MTKNYSPSYVKKYYDEWGMKEWSRLVHTPLEEIKLHIHSYYIKKYVKKGFKVLEIGAGPGRFTQVLDKIGCRVWVTDISAVQLELNKKLAKKYKFSKCVEGWAEVDVTDMKQVKSDQYDVVLAYGGPLSYVFEKKDLAVRECRRVLKKKGLLISSSMSLFGTVHMWLRGCMLLPVDKNRSIVASGDLTPELMKNDKHFCHMFRAKEYRELFTKHGMKVLDMSASNSLSTGHDELLEELRKNRKKWNELLDLELEASVSDGFLDGGTHIITVAQKV